MNEAYAVGVIKDLPSIDEMIQMAEQLRAMAPECWHYDLVTSEFLSTHKDGVVYACVECLKKFVAPRSLFGDSEPPKRLFIDPFAGKFLAMEASE